MQRTYWPTWKNSLERLGLISPACYFMRVTRPLIPFAAQMMFLGMPLFRSSAQGDRYGALLNLMGDEEELMLFINYLQEAGV